MNLSSKLIASFVLAAAATFATADANAAPADAAKAPIGSGNFRRADVLKAAGNLKSSQAYVMGVATAAQHTSVSSPERSRIMAVAHDDKVTLVRAPLDKDVPASRLTQGQANRLGIITQTQAFKLAQKNGGTFGSDGKVRLERAGLSPYGYGYQFKQTAPLGFTRTQYGEKVKVTGITRTVTLSGSGESATVATKALPKP